jgi:hypothetical protein
MPQTSEFHGLIDGHFVIPGTHTAAGGTTNFYFGCRQHRVGAIQYIPRSLYSHLHKDHSIRTHEPFSTVPFVLDPDFVDWPAIAAWVCDKCTLDKELFELVK